MADRWIITKRKYYQHQTLEAAETERERLRAKLPGQTFYLHRIKTDQRPSGAGEKIEHMQRIIADFLHAIGDEAYAQEDQKTPPLLPDVIMEAEALLNPPPDGEAAGEE